MTPLAIDGGTPVRTLPLPGWPAPGAEEIAAVSDVLATGRLNYWTGEQGRLLEAEFAQFTQRTYGIAVANGTLALELALRAFGIGEGDEVIVPSRTFIATASSVVAVGATPVVADIDGDSCNLTAETVTGVISSRTAAVIAVHLAGWPVEMNPIAALAQKHGLIVIEDCAQAHGGAAQDRPVGSLGSHAAAFSFCQDKIIPAGDGGILVLDDADAYRRAWEYKDHGKSLAKLNDAAFMGEPASFRWLHDSFGTNWRLDEMSAAVARTGLAKLPAWHAARTRNATRLAAALAGVSGLRVPLPNADVSHAFYRLGAFLDPERLADGWNRDRVLQAIRAEGVPVQYGSCAEIYREKAFVTSGLGPAQRLPSAARVHDTAVSFFVHPTLTADDTDDAAAAVRKVLAVACR